ncbi:MAG: hypothetical protein KA899_12880 [Acidovorax sp.]|nr:hypothetical protein [Acidovorax sp.]
MGVTQPAISAMMADRRLPQNGTWLELIRAYVGQLRKTAAGRGEEVSELARQKTLLIKAQTEAQDLKNSVARGEYAPIGILADVLALASSAIVDRLDQLEGQLRKAYPDLPEEARMVILRVIADARNEWIRSTSKLVADSLDRMAQSEADEADALDISEGAA